MKFKGLLLTPLLLLIGLNAEVMTGTTVGKYSKPGAPIDMTYLSDPVEKNKTSDINITLTTTVRSGTMNVLLTLDKKLTEISSIKKEITFDITPEQKKYTINLQVSSEEDGLYYIRLLTKINKGVGSKLRAFAVPVKIGKGQIKTRGTSVMMKGTNGENISVSKAIETIKVLKEK
jgi:hypothetical protein